jgi:NADH dehydrogenase FAD-containing subunit
MFCTACATIPLIELVFEKRSPPKPRVLVLGFGWAGKAFVDNIDRHKYNVKVISTTSQRLNQPQMIENLEARWTRPFENTPLHQETCRSIDPLAKTVYCSKAKCEYDYLVVATGAEPNTFNIPGAVEHTYKFKTAEDATRLKEALTTTNNVNIVGSGPTGVELACKLRADGKTVAITEAAPTILPGFSEQMRRRVIETLQTRDITLHLNTKITEVLPDPHRLTVWVAGVKPTPLVYALTDNRPLLTDDRLQLQQQPQIYAMGDAVTGRGPPTAQNAKQQGKFLADHFNRDFQTADSYKYQERGRVLDMSDHLLVEYRGLMFSLPPQFRRLLYWAVD